MKRRTKEVIRKFLSILLTGAILFGSSAIVLPSASISAAGVGSTIAEIFPDQYMAQAVANSIAIGNKNAVLTSTMVDSCKTLALSGNMISSIEGIGNLTGLRNLYLGGNQLTSLPGEIGNLTGLWYLGLGGNQLTSLPAEIGNLTGLEILDLADNQLTSLPVEIGNLTGLTILYLDGNRLTSLPAEIGNLTGLWGLFLNDNQLTSLPAEIGNLTGLYNLNLQNNYLPQDNGYTVVFDLLGYTPEEFKYYPQNKDFNGIYNIKSKKSNLLMDVYNGGKEKGNNIIQWPAHGGINQQWKFERLENGYYKITSQLSGMAMDVYNAGASNGNRVIQWPYHGGNNQQWKLIENSEGTITFISRLSVENGTNYALDVFNGGITAGVNVIQWSLHSGDNQRWYLQPVEEHTLKYEVNGGITIADSSHLPGVLLTEPTTPTKEDLVFGGWYKDAELTQRWNFTKDRMSETDLTLYAKWEQDYSGTYNIRSKNSNLVMDVFNGGSDQGVNIIQWTKHGGINQQWKFEALNNGYYKITSMLSGMSIDVFNGGTEIGNRVIQWPYHGGINQQWKIIKNDDGTVSLMSRLAEESGSKFLLDVYGGGKDMGVNVIQWTSHYGDNQKWYMDTIK